MSAFDWIKARLGQTGPNGSAGPTAPHSQTEQAESSSQIPYSIENAWRDHLAPVIRDIGFKGSGRNYRLITDQFALAVNLQGSRYGTKFTVNLGVQPIAIPNVIGKAVDLKNFKEIECTFRERLTPDGRDTWWSYTDDATSMRDAAQSAARLFRTNAMSQFTERMSFALSATPEMVGRGLPMTLVSLALLREIQGEPMQAKAFAHMARETATPSWITPTSLRHLLDG
jgi:hypothetical protein